MICDVISDSVLARCLWTTCDMSDGSMSWSNATDLNAL
ncbi:hypothetical protein SynBIOSE41_00095 [Synechococcus sp. BIOS-E4-1]|nr:hypothetical protein SynBIOSE41_00095 [Synechococcus sp. BIOS-E4-1]